MEVNSNFQGFVFQTGIRQPSYVAGMVKSRPTSRPAWSLRLNHRRQDLGWSMRTLAARADINYDSVNKYCRGEVLQPRGDNMQRLASALGVSAEWLRDGDLRSLSFPVVGYTGAGDGWIPVEDHQPGNGMDTVEVDFTHLDPVAVRVRGDSMQPVYRDGEAIIGSRVRGAILDEVIGSDCIVLTADGRGLVKIVQRGSGPHLFRLRSYNPLHEDIEDVALEWAAPIILTIRD